MQDAKQKDIGKGIARLNLMSNKQLSVSAGDLVEIAGERRTFVFAWPSHSEDEKQNIIRIDGVTRKNAGSKIGDNVLVRRADAQSADKIILAPVDMRLNVDEDFIGFVKNRLMDRVFFEGDTAIVTMLNHAIPFSVVRSKPREVPVRIMIDTTLSMLNEPFPIPELRVKPPIDIKYLLRFDWLNNLAYRIQANKTVFSISDLALSDENEQKIIDAALKMAREELSNVRIEVSLESDRGIIGTLPWVEIDLYGRISAVYPDIELPTPPALALPKMTQERAFASMKRCFKTGVRSCPKDIAFSPKSVVVAMPFSDEFKDAYKYAIRPALEEAGFKPWKADEQINNIDIMCKICQAIQESGYVLANISSWNPNVVFELGLAYGLGRNAILIKSKKSDVPVDLRGLEYIEYSTMDELKSNLLLFLKGA